MHITGAYFCKELLRIEIRTAVNVEVLLLCEGGLSTKSLFELFDHIGRRSIIAPYKLYLLHYAALLDRPFNAARKVQAVAATLRSRNLNPLY